MFIAEIFTKVIIKVYITHCIRHLVNHVLTLFSEFKFATNRNLICKELMMRKAYQLGRPLRVEPCHISCNTKELIFSEYVLQNKLNSKTYRKYGVTGHFSTMVTDSCHSKNGSLYKLNF